ncbi:hypothetical protein OA857_02820 [Alphaproteobacteria bacterium]|nr:hypothetical protein [Alphaproteobacteria bacterium]
MKTIKLELSVKLLLGAIALGLFLNAFKDFPPKANAYNAQKVVICSARNTNDCANVYNGFLGVTN